tara:strand:+ start:6998 stop:7144 length:147 start_codon:yes stop_codon:yes gene_type:complete
MRATTRPTQSAILNAGVKVWALNFGICRTGDMDIAGPVCFGDVAEAAS